MKIVLILWTFLVVTGSSRELEIETLGNKSRLDFLLPLYFEDYTKDKIIMSALISADGHHIKGFIVTRAFKGERSTYMYIRFDANNDIYSKAQKDKAYLLKDSDFTIRKFYLSSSIAENLLSIWEENVLSAKISLENIYLKTLMVTGGVTYKMGMSYAINKYARAEVTYRDATPKLKCVKLLDTVLGFKKEDESKFKAAIEAYDSVKGDSP